MGRSDKLQELKTLRSKGKTRLSVYESVEQPQIFETVSEDFFHEVSKRRAMEDDFVVDDNGEGYVAPLEDWVNDFIM
jgi:DNA polymerase alpha subunit A